MCWVVSVWWKNCLCSYCLNCSSKLCRLHKDIRGLVWSHCCELCWHLLICVILILNPQVNAVPIWHVYIVNCVSIAWKHDNIPFLFCALIMYALSFDQCSPLSLMDNACLLDVAESICWVAFTLQVYLSQYVPILVVLSCLNSHINEAKG